MVVADVMTPAPVFVSADDTAAEAALVLRTHRLPVVSVLDAGNFVGALTPADLLGERPVRRVGELMARRIVPATPDLPLLQAHALLRSQRLEFVPVVQDNSPAGHLALSAVLRAISQSTDPLTGLPWATALRTWAADTLGRGREISVLFVDCDKFRDVNRAFGFVAGDGVLRTIADLLQQCVDPTTDLLCRYAGDKFAIAAARTDEEARALAVRIGEVVTIPVEPDRRVTVSVGYAGGRRRGVREPGHAAATVYDLLAMAGRAARLAKAAPAAAARREAAIGQPALPQARVQLLDVRLESYGGRPAARVGLRLGSRRIDGVSSGLNLSVEQAPRFLVADATLRALHGILEEQTYILETVLDSLFDAQPVAVAVLSERGKPGQAPERYIGGATAPDLPRAVSKAVLDAVNRPLAHRLGAILTAEGSA